MDVANNFIGEKAKRKQLFSQIFKVRCPRKGVLYDEIDTCRFVCLVTYLLTGRGAEDFDQAPPPSYFNLATGLAPVVQKMDSAIPWINIYPVDNPIGFINTYPVDSAIHLSNNWGLKLWIVGR